jgi:hypothetical protein
MGRKERKLTTCCLQRRRPSDLWCPWRHDAGTPQSASWDGTA